MGRPESPDRVRLGKADLRRQVLWTMGRLPADELAAQAAAATDRLLALPELLAARTVAAYASIPPELPTGPLLDVLLSRDVRVLLPALLPDASLAWRRYDGSMAPGPRGTSEARGPYESLESAELVLVPGVAFDPAGRRLGRGGGSYDRALAAVTVPVVAMAADAAIVEAVPAEPHDVDVDLIVTPTRVVRCRPLDGRGAMSHD